MRLITLSVCSVLLLVGISCTENLPTSLEGSEAESTISTASDNAAIVFGKKTKGATVLKDQFMLEEEDFVVGPYFMPCLNGGDGEEVTFTVSYRYMANIVTTPSGHEHLNGWLDEWSNEFAGATTGDHWVGSGIAHISEHIKADGRYRAVEPLRETFVKDGTGEKLKLLWHFKVTPEIPFSFELINCSLLGAR
ncbi:MAG: hypothetical protein HKN13_08975 [Rhodothermales bacterium]|nr:hypothetical protein [Rhodothermales bacterium]